MRYRVKIKHGARVVYSRAYSTKKKAKRAKAHIHGAVGIVKS